MRFLADMGISPATVAFLRDQGHDAIHLHEQDLDRLEDSCILEKGLLEARVILTHDLDFAELIAASAARLPSIVIFRLRNMRPEMVNDYLHTVTTDHRAALEQGAVVSVSERQIRVRLLPIEADQ
jgi:predicted nuclease of predicted toxin-antitoxin system